MSLRLFIVGHGRHGKDTAGNILKEVFNLQAVDSSWFMAKNVCRPYMEKLGVTYDSVQECYDDRHNYRMEWRRAIREYNGEDEARLSKAIFAENDIYVGIRSRDEFLAARPISDLAIWIDASKRKDYRDPSLDILPTDCDVIVDNNGTEADLRQRILRLGYILNGYKRLIGRVSQTVGGYVAPPFGKSSFESVHRR